MSSTTLPEWAQWLQLAGPLVTGVGTIAIAGFVAVVSYRQWVTAREKLALDLFEKRLEIYDQCIAALRLAIRDGDAKEDDIFRHLHQSLASATFLFGDDVAAYIKAMINDCANLRLANIKMRDRAHLAQEVPEALAQDWPQVGLDANLRLAAAFDDLAKVLAPYMRMDKPLPGTRSATIEYGRKIG